MPPSNANAAVDSSKAFQVRTVSHITTFATPINRRTFDLLFCIESALDLTRVHQLKLDSKSSPGLYPLFIYPKNLDQLVVVKNISFPPIASSATHNERPCRRKFRFVDEFELLVSHIAQKLTSLPGGSRLNKTATQG
eukprot:764289-Hanusia_phi.AAC.6